MSLLAIPMDRVGEEPITSPLRATARTSTDTRAGEGEAIASDPARVTTLSVSENGESAANEDESNTLNAARGIPGQEIAEGSEIDTTPVSSRLTLQDFRDALTANSNAPRFIIVRNGDTASIQPAEVANGTRDENLTIIDVLRDALEQERSPESRAIVAQVIGQNNFLTYGNSHLNAARLSEILNRSDAAQQMTSSSRQGGGITTGNITVNMNVNCDGNRSGVNMLTDLNTFPNIDKYLQDTIHNNIYLTALANVARLTEQQLSGANDALQDKKATSEWRAAEEAAHIDVARSQRSLENAERATELSRFTNHSIPDLSVLAEERVARARRETANATLRAIQARRSSLNIEAAEEDLRATQEDENIAKANIVFWRAELAEEEATRAEQDITQSNEIKALLRLAALWKTALNAYAKAIVDAGEEGVIATINQRERWNASLNHATDKSNKWSQRYKKQRVAPLNLAHEKERVAMAAYIKFAKLALNEEKGIDVIVRPSKQEYDALASWRPKENYQIDICNEAAHAAAHASIIWNQVVRGYDKTLFWRTKANELRQKVLNQISKTIENKQSKCKILSSKSLLGRFLVNKIKSFRNEQTYYQADKELTECVDDALIKIEKIKKEDKRNDNEDIFKKLNNGIVEWIENCRKDTNNYDDSKDYYETFSDFRRKKNLAAEAAISKILKNDKSITTISDLKRITAGASITINIFLNLKKELTAKELEGASEYCDKLKIAVTSLSDEEEREDPQELLTLRSKIIRLQDNILTDKETLQSNETAISNFAGTLAQQNAIAVAAAEEKKRLENKAKSIAKKLNLDILPPDTNHPLDKRIEEVGNQQGWNEMWSWRKSEDLISLKKLPREVREASSQQEEANKQATLALVSKKNKEEEKNDIQRKLEKNEIEEAATRVLLVSQAKSILNTYQIVDEAVNQFEITDEDLERIKEEQRLEDEEREKEKARLSNLATAGNSENQPQQVIGSEIALNGTGLFVVTGLVSVLFPDLVSAFLSQQ